MGGNILGGDFPWGSLIGGNSQGDNFPRAPTSEGYCIKGKGFTNSPNYYVLARVLVV